LSYAELVEAASLLELPKEPTLKDAKDFKIIGKPLHRSDIPLKTNGAAIFGIDMTVPGMLYATIERCAVIGGTLKNYDAAETLKMPGVVKVVEVERIMGNTNLLAWP
jgi:isoquinoline 1-oxidoreductase beta subunit